MVAVGNVHVLIEEHKHTKAKSTTTRLHVPLLQLMQHRRHLSATRRELPWIPRSRLRGQAGVMMEATVAMAASIALDSIGKPVMRTPTASTLSSLDASIYIYIYIYNVLFNCVLSIFILICVCTFVFVFMLSCGQGSEWTGRKWLLSLLCTFFTPSFYRLSARARQEHTKHNTCYIWLYSL